MMTAVGAAQSVRPPLPVGAATQALITTVWYPAVAAAKPAPQAIGPPNAPLFTLGWERARDLTTIIDAVLRDAVLGAVIDRARIGAAGFSLGQAPNAEGCAAPPECPDLLARRAELQKSSASFREATSHAGDSYRDARCAPCSPSRRRLVKC